MISFVFSSWIIEFHRWLTCTTVVRSAVPSETFVCFETFLTGLCNICNKRALSREYSFMCFQTLFNWSTAVDEEIDTKRTKKWGAVGWTMLYNQNNISIKFLVASNCLADKFYLLLGIMMAHWIINDLNSRLVAQSTLYVTYHISKTTSPNSRHSANVPENSWLSRPMMLSLRTSGKINSIL